MSHSNHSSNPHSAQNQKQEDYHGHPNYVAIWAILVALLFASLACGWLGNKELEVAGIFTLAIVKAILVLGNFMHLRWEPKMLWGVAGFGVLCLFFLYFGVAPDIVHVHLQLAH